MLTNDQLAAASRRVGEAAGSAADWFEHYRDRIGAGAPAMRKEFRRYRAVARRNERAARKPMCVGVFGESQSGKSYLISALARRGHNPLVAVFGSREIQFLDLNPESGGENEATGLVTRFTIHAPGAPASHPVALRLLSQTDFVKILANTYLLDFHLRVEQPPGPETIEQALAQARGAARNRPVDTLTEDDIDDLHEYFEREFSGRATKTVLEQAGYWQQLEELAPRLDLDDRVKLYEFLWGSNQAFSSVYKQLYGALATLGFPEEASTTIDAIENRAASILNVETLRGLLEPQGSKIEVATRDGQNIRTIQIHRAHLAAIIAEMVVMVKEKPADYFEHTDLLDFPGLRPRLDLQVAPQQYLKDMGDLGMQELYRRGKVAYLFDRYCAERELTSMLLCVQPGNQNTRVLPHMVLKWIHSSHGETPVDRAEVDTALFLVLTKFDKHFAETQGKKEDHDTLREQWSRAIDTALLDFFGKDKDNWPRDWHPAGAFDNVLWIRNPGWVAPGLMRYDSADSKREIGIDRQDRVDRFKAAYLDSPLIRRHVRDADGAWQAAFVLNDGGVTYLGERLAPVCRPELKTSQLEHRLRDLQRRMLARLDAFYISEDGAEEAKKRTAAAAHAADNLAEVAEQLRFGHLLSELQVDRTELQYALYWSGINGEELSATGAVRPKKSRIRWILGRVDAHSSSDSDDRASHIANRALEHWADRLRTLSQDERRIAFLKIEGASLATLTRELLDASMRIQLENRLAEDIRRLTHVAEESPVLKPAIACAERINGFVHRLGQDVLKPAERAQVPANGSGKRPVFVEQARIDVLDSLPERAEPHFETFIGEWLASFEHLVKCNAESAASGANTEHNRKLGEIRANLTS